MHRLLKRSIELGLARFGLTGAWRRFSGRNGIVLAYHNIVPAGDVPVGDSSLHLPFPAFKAQVDLLSKTHVIVSLKEFLGSGAPYDKPMAAITFDDAYRGGMELGVTELIGRDIPVTVFVAPGLLDSEGFWWDLVADPSLGEVPAGFRDHAFETLGGRQELILERAGSVDVNRKPLPDLYRPAAAEYLDALARHPLVSLGSHTWNHVHLPTVPPGEAAKELQRSRAWLQDHSVCEPFLLSYPYGAFHEGLEALVREAGYEAAFLVEGGAMRRRDIHACSMTIPRLNVPRDLSPEGFQLRVSGAWPR
jgi:peptidoglycan/xylan/chitin deacetylase (PgdA/CDA1 family)